MNTENQVNANQKTLVVKIVLVEAAIVALAVLFSMYNSGRTSAQQSQTVIQGSVKMTEIDLNSMLDGYIDAVNVEEGDEVKAGDVILQIEPDIVQAKVKEAEAALGQARAGLAQAQAAHQAAQAVLAKAQNGARPEDIAQAKAAYDYAAVTYERMKPLYADGAVSANDFDGIEAKYLAAKAVYEQAQNGARPEDIAAAQAQVAQASAAISQYQATIRQAEGAVEEATTYLNHAAITAPSDGVITAVNVEKGELISTGMALVSMRAAGEAWVEVNVPETSLSMVKQGQQVELFFPAYNEQRFAGTIINVSKSPDFAIKKATNENGSFDVLSYTVKIRLDDMTETLYAGMTAMVDFAAGAQAE